MPGKPKDQSAVRKAVVRILSGNSDVGKEASRVGCSTRTLERALKTARDGGVEPAKAPSPAPMSEAPEVDSPGETIPVSDAAIAKAAASGTPAGRDTLATPITKSEIQLATVEARKVDEEYCLSRLKTLKGAGIMLASWPLGVSLNDPRLEDLMDFRLDARLSIKQNSEWLAPILRKYLGDGKWELAVALAMDGFFTYQAMKNMRYAPPPAASSPGDQAAAAAAPPRPPARTFTVVRPPAAPGPANVHPPVNKAVPVNATKPAAGTPAEMAMAVAARGVGIVK
jgi:hypothetical protein